MSALAPELRIVFVGHVDHGKSTLVGHLVELCGAMPEGKVDQLRAVARRRGMAFEWAFLLDALQAERDQGVTIDTTQVRFHSAARGYLVIDAPGHVEFLRNMVTGAARADAAVLVVDAHEGIREQTHRHATILRLIGITRLIVAVNKMDLVGWDRARYAAIRAELAAWLDRIGVPAGDVPVIPVSARDGDNLAALSERTPWYDGPSVIAALDAVPAPLPASDLPLRLAVQDVYKFDHRRIVAGRIESGRLAVGDALTFWPSRRSAKVASIETWNAAPQAVAQAGQAVGITLDQPVFVERGQIASHEADPPALSSVFRARVLWLGTRPLAQGAWILVRLLTAAFEAQLERIEAIVDADDLTRRDAAQIAAGEIGEAVLRTRAPIACDEFRANARTGRFVIVADYRIAGGGTISLEGYPDHRRGEAVRSANISRVKDRVEPAERQARNGHRGGILWLTGLSGSGKSTLAMELERALFDKGMQVAVLDGDNLRFGLNADLGFSPNDRAENVRRAGEVAALLAGAGMICITAFISPYRADRERIRAAHPDLFHEIHLAASVAECERRDVKGLYARARRGEIADFTGISAPYEAPGSPELRLATGSEAVAESLAALVAYAERAFR